MDLIADILLAGGALAAALYCMVLSRRLGRFSRLDEGVGGAIAVLSGQVDDLTRALDKAKGTAQDSAASLDALTVRAEGVATRLELMLAAMHDVPDPAATAAAANANAPGPATLPREREGRRVRVTRQRAARGAMVE